MKSGDHENYHALNSNNLTAHLIHKNCSFVNADCQAKAIKIRTMDEHFMWPNITGNTLMFSRRKSKPPFLKETDIKEDIDYYEWRKTVKSHYG